MKKTDRFDSSNIAVEFKRTELGDVRLSRRLTAMAVALGRDPSASLPDVFGDSAGIEGCDRFLRNDKVSFDRVLRPHQQQTIRRARCETQFLVVHDTTEFRFSSPREDLGFLTGNTKDQGFYGHFSLALGGEDFRTPLGIINTQLHFQEGWEARERWDQ